MFISRYGVRFVYGRIRLALWCGEAGSRGDSCIFGEYEEAGADSAGFRKQLSLLHTFLCGLYRGRLVEKWEWTPLRFRCGQGYSARRHGVKECVKNIEKLLNIDAYDIYGFIGELRGPGVAYECREKQGLHVCEDYAALDLCFLTVSMESLSLLVLEKKRFR